MGGVHVHQHQADSVLGKDIDAFQLRQRVTQRRDIALALGQRIGRHGTFTQRCIKATVGRLRFSGRHRLRRTRCVLILVTRATAAIGECPRLGLRLFEHR
ncbi:hypothetical protein D3C76_1291920 [compost metagenome]